MGDRVPIRDAELTVLRGGIHAKRRQDHGLVERVNGTGRVPDGFALALAILACDRDGGLLLLISHLVHPPPRRLELRFEIASGRAPLLHGGGVGGQNIAGVIVRGNESLVIQGGDGFVVVITAR